MTKVNSFRKSGGNIKTYQILTNLNCNLACKYCYENKCNKVNNIESIKTYLTALYERDYGIKYEDEELPCVMIDVIGGESFLYPELLDEMCEHLLYLTKMYEVGGDFVVNITTNGTLLTTKPVQDFIMKWRSHLAIGLSIDGTKKIHDTARVYPNGAGSYDKAVAGWGWLKHILPPCRTGVKATYCHDTINNYGDGVINLIKLGFTDIGANVIFEEIWTEEDTVIIYEQMKKVVDYIVDNKLEKTVHIFQLNNKELDIANYQPNTGPKDKNHCGSCTHMLCLGFDNKLYGCNRFCTMENPIPLGELINGKIKIHNTQLIDEIANQYNHWHEDCKKCGIGQQCPSCSVIPYEKYPDNPMQFFREKPQCGFTTAMVAARVYFSRRLLTCKDNIV
ncbi:MAG: hypothetical protein RR203_02555 [Synergistaceae bacterium]